MNKSDLIMIREFMPEQDKNFILATFLRGLFYGESWFSEIKKSIFMDYYNKVVNHIIDSPKTSISIACLKEHPYTILGYAILSKPDIVHYVFVKKKWRGIGLAKDLVPSSATTATHLTKVGLAITKKKGFDFNPFVI